MANLSDRELSALLQAEKANALASQQASKLTAEREDALSYYMGDMADDMPSVVGRSSAVSTDVFDTIESMLPDLIEIFTAGDEVVRYNPVGPEDEQAAEQETQYVNHVFLQKNDGFLILYSYIKDALLSKNGFVKVFWEESEEEEQQTVLDQPEDVLALVQSQPDVEVVEHTEHDGLHDFTIAHKRNYGCAKITPVPPEEFGCARDTRRLRDTRYCFHQVRRYEQDLIDEGYDADQVRKLPTFGETQNTEEDARDTVAEGSEGQRDGALNKSMRPIEVTEHYIRMDYNGRGVRVYRVTTGGGTCQVLRHKQREAIEPVNRIPFASMTPIIVPHRLIGLSVADVTMDVQRIKTALLRALLDNAYLAVNPMVEVAQSHTDATTQDDLLVRRPGNIVRTIQPGGLNILEHPGVGDDVFPLFEYQDQVKEWRTGVTRQGQGMDPNVLNNQSATAAAQMHNAAKAKLKLIARIFAETGIKDMFWLLHAVIRENASQADTFQISKKWVTIDPRTWKSRNDLTLSVGLGTGSKQEQLAAHQMVIAAQKELLLAGKTNMVSDVNLWNSCKKLVKLAGEKSPETYFTDPATQPPPEPKPDPEMIKIQGQLEVEKMQAQADIASTDKKLQADLAKIAAAMEQDRREHEQRMIEMREKHAIEIKKMQMQNIAADLQHERSMREQAAGGSNQRMN